VAKLSVPSRMTAGRARTRSTNGSSALVNVKSATMGRMVTDELTRLSRAAAASAFGIASRASRSSKRV
jgi:hypothetical protein